MQQQAVMVHQEAEMMQQEAAMVRKKNTALLEEMEDNWDMFHDAMDNKRMQQFGLFERLHDLEREHANASAKNEMVAFPIFHKLY